MFSVVALVSIESALGLLAQTTSTEDVSTSVKFPRFELLAFDADSEAGTATVDGRSPDELAALETAIGVTDSPEIEADDEMQELLAADDEDADDTP